MKDILNCTYTNKIDQTYIVNNYEGKNEKKQHVYKITFTTTNNSYLEPRQRVKNSLCRDNELIALQRKQAKQQKRKEALKVTKPTIKFSCNVDWNNENVLFVDQSTTATGIVIVRNKKEYETHVVEPDQNDVKERSVFIGFYLLELIKTEKIKQVFFEGIYQGVNASVALKLGWLLGALEMVGALQNCKTHVVPAMYWKSYHKIAGERIHQKEQARKIASKWLKDPSEDEADAFCMAIAVIKQN